MLRGLAARSRDLGVPIPGPVRTRDMCYVMDEAMPEKRKYARHDSTRMKYLLTRLAALAFVVIWCIVSAIARYAEVPPDLIHDGSRAALLPIWFLAVYIMVTVAVPYWVQLVPSVDR